ncbi:MAG: threonylcarbamoyl-AMP synthase [Candidatus Doudnabacteria bacterium]|nr:threonylcarbamoyl-AMP synthase [Candidatus Doudnabacteria bacterium]
MNSVDQAVKILKQGKVVVYPTDTAYGLAVDATNAKAVNRLFALKGRDFRNPVHIIIPSGNWLTKIVSLSTTALKLMNKFLPGPLTVVLPLKIKGSSWKKLSAGTKTIGIRLPNNKIALELVEKLGKPITTTSANISGQSACYSVLEVKKQFEKSVKKPDIYLNGGKLKKIKPSTVVLLTGERAKIIRLGPISEKQIKNAIK